MVAFWQDRPTLVTGATGFVGSWLVRRLVNVHADCICLIRDWVPQSELLWGGLVERVKLIRGDVRDQPLIERALGEHEIDTVFHLAAQTIVGVANRNPISTFESNIRGTWSLLEACRRSPLVKQVVIASSDKAYGDQPTLPYSEDMPLRGVFPYDVSKSCADKIAAAYATTYGLPVVITRCGNFYGGGDLNWNRIVPGTIRSILRGRRPIIRSDGCHVRDYFYVEDGAHAYMSLAHALAHRPSLKGEAYNFSNEVPLTVLELVQRILDQMDSDLEPDILCQASHEIVQQSLNAAKARRDLNWSPLFNLGQGLKRTISWYTRFLSRAPVPCGSS